MYNFELKYVMKLIEKTKKILKGFPKSLYGGE